MKQTIVRFPVCAKKVTAVFLAILALLFFVRDFPAPAYAASDGFYVNGTTICDANGNSFKMRGVNISHAWYTSYTETSLAVGTLIRRTTLETSLLKWSSLALR